MTLIERCLRGVREHLRTQLVSVATVALALFCLGGALLAVENARALAERWGAPVRMTVYLSDGATAAQIEALRAALAAVPDVAETRYVSPADARAQLARGGDAALAQAPADLFPATLELRLAPGAVSADRVSALSDRVRRLGTVTGVETYRGVTDRLRELMASGRLAALAVALLVLLCAIAVVSNTVRLSLHARRREVEVLRMVGASPGYVRAPFLIEGALLGGGGAVVALAVLAGVFFAVRDRFEGAVGGVLGLHPVFLSWGLALALLAGGGALGATGSALALRKWLEA